MAIMAGVIPDEGLDLFDRDRFSNELITGYLWKVVLFKDLPGIVDKDTVFTDCTEADYDTYVPEILGSPTYINAGPIIADTASLTFPPIEFSGGVVTPNVIRAWGIVSNTIPRLLVAVEPLGSDFNMIGDGQILKITPRLTVTDP